MKHKILLLLITLLSPLLWRGTGGEVFAQTKTDSLLTILKKPTTHDTTKLHILNDLIEAEADDKVWQPYNLQMKTLGEQLAQSSDEQIKAAGNKALAAALNNIGFVYDNQGNAKEALDYFSRSLKLREQINDKHGMAEALNNIGLIYDKQGQIKEALEYYTRSLKLNEQIKNKQGIASSLNNIGFVYNNQGQIKEALDYFTRSLKIREQINDKQGIAISLNNIGGIYKNQGQLKEALDYLSRSLKIQEQINDKQGIAYSLNNIGGIYLKEKKYALALAYSDSSLAVAKQIGYAKEIRNAEKQLTNIYKEMGDKARAFDHYEQYIIYKDSLSNQETQKALTAKQMNFEYEKKEALAKAEHDAETKQQKIITWSVGGGLLLVLVFAGFIFRSLRITRRQKQLIDKAYAELHQKNEEVMASIRYAKRIQDALMTKEKYIHNALNRLMGSNKSPKP
ncbi:MAG TPA: tetratricopeptide repeat protein [Bacteroidia bacterium]